MINPISDYDKILISFYETRLINIESELKLCHIDMQDGNDYEYSQDRFDSLVTERENVRLDFFSHKRRLETKSDK